MLRKMLKRLCGSLLLLPALALGAANHYNILDTTTITGGSFVNGTYSGASTFPGLAPSSLVLTNGGRVLGSYGGTLACTNAFVRSLSAAGVAVCNAVANGDLAGSIAASKLIGTDIATVGTITAGTWNSTAIGAQWGGTGQNFSSSTGILQYSAGTASLLSSSGTGNVVRVTSPTLITPTLGAALATSINGNAITTGTGTLTLGAGKTLTSSSTLTLTGTDGSTLNVGTGGTLGTAAYTAATAYAPAAGSTSITTLGTVTTGTWSATAIAPTRGGTGQSTTATSGRYLKGDGTSWGTSSGSASGTGACGANSWASTLNSDAAPTCTQPSAANLSNGTTGSGAVVLATSPTLVTPVLGVAAATSVTAQSFAGTGGSNTYSVSGGGIGGTNTVALGNAAGVASIQALTSASAAAPLQINASGGSVTIGGTTVPASSTLLTTASTQIIAQSSTGGSVTGSATAYIAPGVASNALAEATRQAVIPRATVVRNLYIVTSTAQPADGVLVVTLRKNGVNTAITATIAANAAAGTFSDTTHSASFAAGDLLSLGLVNASASSSALLVGYGITVDLQ